MHYTHVYAVYRADLFSLFNIDLIYVSIKEKQFAPDSIEF